jgi:hypothetical protein
LLFGTRNPAAGGDLAGLPALVLEGLVDADARALLASVIPGWLDERVRDRIIAESGGNPLALLELPHGVTAAEWAGGFGVAGPRTADWPDRAKLPAADRAAPGGHQVPAPARRGRADRRSDVAVAGGRTSWHQH